jgi:hypothetical protein
MKNLALKFSPLLVLYFLLVIMFSSTNFRGDEAGYVEGATRLSQGTFFADSDIMLVWGPGYPLVLVPFVLLDLPWLAAKSLNVFLLFGAIIYLYKTLLFWIPEKYALIVSLVMGLFPPFLRYIPFLLSENLNFFLICGFIFHFCKSQSEPRGTWLQVLLASIFLAFLALTKILYGYVILVGLVSFLILSLWKKRTEFQKTTYIYLLALIWCLPYLMRTYALSGELFYWGSSGGNNLYWMSTPYENEWGDWFSASAVQTRPELAQHREVFNRIAGLSQIEQDRELKRQSIENITDYPEKYLVNWMANIGRMLFSYPFSHRPHRITTFFYLIPNMFVVVLFALSIYPAILRWKSIPFAIYALLYIFLLAFGGTSLVSADSRQFAPLVPILVLWLTFLYIRIMKIEVRPVDEIVST